MLPSNKAFDALNGTQKPLAFVCVYCVLQVLLMCHQLQVFKTIVRAVKVLVVNLKSISNRPNKSFPHQSVYDAARCFSVAAKVYMQVAFNRARPKQTVTFVADPYNSAFDVAGRSHASAQKVGHFAKQRTFLKHTFSFGHINAVQSFASCNSAHVPKIADFVQIFKLRHWLPRFHALPLFNENRSVA